ncbi:hypothetical protein C0584_04530 [Candidatus Parcubacteria bacterium]|nr:MAG: hypothetical protein C0584_04530 [Candidatus Parcubacteria bacterium]
MVEKIENTQTRKAWWQPAMALFLRMSAWIGVPVIIAAFLGKWFDNRYNSEPWGILGFIGLSFIISMVGIVRQAGREYKKIESEENNKNN